jgi:hypothetical protein
VPSRIVTLKVVGKQLQQGAAPIVPDGHVDCETDEDEVVFDEVVFEDEDLGEETGAVQAKKLIPMASQLAPLTTVKVGV